VKWISTMTILSILTWIHISSRPHLIRISSTRICTTWTNHICRIGIIRLNMCPSSNIMNKTGIIITTLHRVRGDTTLPSHMVNYLTTSSFIYSFSRTAFRRTKWLGKEDGSLRGTRTMNSKSRKLKISSKFSNLRSLLHFSSSRVRKEYGIYDSISKRSLI